MGFVLLVTANMFKPTFYIARADVKGSQILRYGVYMDI